MTLVNKKITPEELAQRLVNSKKVMRKVDTGDYETGNINEQAFISNEPEVVIEGEKPIEVQPTTKFKPLGPVNTDKINQSKLPDAIKKAMIENPIPQITLNDSLDMDVVNKAKRLMEQENISSQKQSSGKRGQPPSPMSNKISLNSSDLERALSPIIENIVRKVMDEKLNQILAAQQLQTINENLVLKVGDSIFQGKITKVKSAK